MAIFSNIGAIDRGESPWSMNVSSDGTVSITERKVGAVKDVVAWAKAFSIGTVYQLNASEDCPFSGYFIATGANVEVSVAGTASGTRTYSQPGGESGGLSSDEGAQFARTEKVDFSTIEKPVTSAKFWTDAFPATCEGNKNPTKALKQVQLYIDAPTEAEAEKIYNNFSDSSAQSKMASKLIAGIEAYLYPAPTASLSFETKQRQEVGGEVGKIVDAPELEHVSAPGGFEWLCNGDAVEWSSGTGVYTRTKSWIGANSWDKDLYEKAGGKTE